MDKIIVSGLRVFAHHGVLPSEQKVGQPFVLDIVLHTDLKKAVRTDNLADTVNYDEVCRITSHVMRDDRYFLIECAAQAVCDRLFAEFKNLEVVEITLKKPRAPLCADVEYAAAYLYRTRADYEESGKE